MMQDLYDMMDNAVCEFLHITQDQLEHVTDLATMEELETMMEPIFKEDCTISDVKASILIRDKYLKQNGIWVELEPRTSVE